MAINYSFELHEFDEALTPYGTIETDSPARADITVTDFTSGTHFRTGPEDGTDSLVLELEDRLLTVVLDESGSMTWNDVNGDRYTYFTRLLTKLRDTYPGEVQANLIGFGGTLAVTKLLVTQASTDFLSSGEGQDLNVLLQDTFQDSVYDFAGVRVVRRTDRFPTHPADGVVVGEGILDAVKDEPLTEGQIYYYGVWTFNKDLNFSTGKFISGTPFDRILPQGVNFATATPRILPGITRDSNTNLIYNLTEGSGTTAFDSSGKGNHGILGSEVIEDNFWLGDAAAGSQEDGGESKKPVGVRFDGEFDILEATVSTEDFEANLNNPKTVNFWMYRYANTEDQWIIGTADKDSSNAISWMVGVGSDGRIGASIDKQVPDISNGFPYFSGSGNFVPLETWTMVTVQFLGNVGVLYINGSNNNISNFLFTDQPSQSVDRLYIGAKPVDSANPWTGVDFFGSLAQISIHNTIRDADYVSSLFLTESLIFDQPLQNASENPPDNTQREVLLSWDIGSDFDFEGGQVKIIRKYREVPDHADDGDLVLQQSASAGQFYYIDSFDFINNADYYYRIFTINAIGNICDRAEARVLGVRVPASPAGLETAVPSAVTNVSVLNGNKKVMLQWSNPPDPDWRGTKIYFGAEQFPTISVSGQGGLEVSNGFEIFDTQDPNQESFVHRKLGVDKEGVAIPLENGKFQYYTFITYDRLGFLSDADFIIGTPSAALTTVFPPAEVDDLHLTIVNPKTLSVQWTNPIVKADTLQLFFGESALIFVSIKDIFGGSLDDLVNISLQVCTDITDRDLTAKDQALGALGPGDAVTDPCGNPNIVLINGGCNHGARLEDDCNDEQEEAETVLTFASVESGLIKGVLTHTSDPSILTRRERYEMSVRAQYIVENPETDQLLFALNTEAVNVSFQHPLEMALINKDERTITPPCGSTGDIRGRTICPNNCSGGTGSGSSCNPEATNGTHINASKPYLVRVELQYKGEALPSGTPVNVQLFKSSADLPLQIKSSRVSIREGVYNTTAVQEPLLDSSGNPTGDVVNKSIVDIEIPAPDLPEKVDLYVSIQYLGFFVDGVHSLEFIGSLFIQVDANQPFADGISTAEQTATVWTVDPDNPEDFNSKAPAPDGTLVKWELVKLRHGRDRPFYSTEPINELVSGIYSATANGVARNVFFGPVANVESHTEQVCNTTCCIGEEYAVKASVILGEETAVDQVYIAYPCKEDEELLFNAKLFMNAQAGQPGEKPNYITWADGEHLLKFSIAKNPAIVTDEQIPGATCFRDCLEAAFDEQNQLIPFPEGHIVQVTAPADILWDVDFGADFDSANVQTFESSVTSLVDNAMINRHISPSDDPTWLNPTNTWLIGYVNVIGIEDAYDAYARFIINVPEGHVIQSAKIEFTPQSVQSSSQFSDLGIIVIDPTGLPQNIDLSSSNSDTLLAQGSIGDQNEVLWKPHGGPAGSGGSGWDVQEASDDTTTPDLSEAVQAFVDRDDYEPGETIIFKIRDRLADGQPLGVRVVQPMTYQQTVPPKLIIESAPPTPSGSNLDSFEEITIPEDRDNATAGIPIDGDTTDFYVRLNKFIGDGANPQPEDCDQGGGGGGGGGGGDPLLSCEWENTCKEADSCSPTKGTKWTGVRPVFATSTFVSDNNEITLTGGGGYDMGMPPVMVGFKEPLDVSVIEARLNGQRLETQELVVDGASQHTIVVEVKFANSPVPDGTVVELFVEETDTSVIQLSNCTTENVQPGCHPAATGIIYTSQVNDPFINPDGDKRSLAYFTINPLPNIAFNGKINVTCRYDKLGTAEREITRCVELNNTINVDTPDPEQPPTDEPPPITSVTSNEAIVYDTVADQYSTTNGGNINRMGHFTAGDTVGTTSNIYSISGYTDRDIDGTAKLSATAEKFDVATAQWSFITNIPTPRTSGMTVIVDDDIYCIGGLELDPITDQYVVSRKIEAYNTASEAWNPSLESMPEDNGVAFGDAQYDGSDNIYVLCGVTKVVNNNQPDTLNERILRYTISTDTWTTIRPLDVPGYKRIAPFGFFRDNPLPVFEQTLNWEVQNGEDDAEYSVVGGWETTEDQLQIGSVSGVANGFFRFPLNIRPNRVIVSATLTVYAYDNDTTDACSVDIYLLDLDNVDAFEDATDVHDTATSGSPVSWDWTNELLTAGAAAVSPDIKSLIQSFVNRSGYTQGNYIGIKLDGTPSVGANTKRTVSAAEDSFANNATLDITYLDGQEEQVLGYIYGGSIPKTLAEINAEFQDQLDQALNDFRSFILTSPYYLALTAAEQANFIETEEQNIRDSIVVAPYIYPATGFKYDMGSEHFDSTNDLIIDIADKVDNEWPVLPKPRDRGRCTYIASQDTAYFMGGSNQNQSTTLNRVESVDLASNANTYLRLTPFSRGRALFGAVAIQDDVYLSGGLTSGHKAGYVQIDLKQGPTLVEAQGTQSSGVVITLRDDAGELIDQDIRCIVRGRLRVPEIDSILSGFLADRAADRALGGDGSGNAPDLPGEGETIDFAALIEAQNSIIDPNSDQFQFNAAKKLGEQVFLFPVLYSATEFTISSGIGGVTLLPRSEDPLADFQRLAQFIQETLASTPPDPNERFQGDLTREELAALGDALQTVQLPPTILDSNTIRDLYQIETVVTIIDDVYFGQTVSDFDLDIQEQINSRIEQLLTPPPEEEDPEEEEDPGGSGDVPFGGIPVSESDCFLLQHVAAQEIPPADQPPPPQNQNNQGPGGTGGTNQSGQCLFCQALLPLKPSIKLQLPTSVATFFNSNDWVPQIKKRLTTGHTLDEVIDELDIIDHETPFGASQLYSAMKQAAIVSTGETFESRKKVFYIGSDNSENFSLITRDEAIDEINAVDGDGNSPVIYPVFSTSFPTSLSAQLERTETGDIEKIVKATGGQSSTLISSGFLDQILNLTIGGATGGLGWGKYNQTIDLGELSAITDVTTTFVLPLNTQGFLRFRYSQDEFNFTDWTERFEGSLTVDFVDFFARLLEYEVVLTTGFSADVTPEYDSTATGIPKLTSIVWGTSGEREDFIYLNSEDVLTNAQQVAASFDGSVPSSSTIEIGVASSTSHNWNDFQSSSRPAIPEFGKTFLLERTDDPFSLVPIEPLTSRDGLLYSTTYGPWDPTSTASLFRIDSDGTEVPVLTGFRLHPREGQIYFDARQDPTTVFKLAIVNSDKIRVGLRLRNRLHTDSIAVQGVGYIYSTNDEKPIELSQVAPRAINVLISPQNPNTSDTVFGLYDYVDLNGDPESGTIIKWFKNGSQLFEINNKTSWVNNDLQTNNQLQPNDKLYFNVTPSDGRDFGSTVFSPTVTVAALPPNAQDLAVIAIRNGLTNERFDTASTYQVNYSFEVDDEGQNAQEFGTEIRWFVNGFLFKEGTFSEGDTFDENNLDPRQLARDEQGSAPGPNQGTRAHIVGNEILVEVTPKTPLITGEQTISDPFSVVNSLALITNVAIAPAEPNTGSTLQLTYDIDDPDIDDEIEAQTDQSEIKWLVSVDGVNFVENTDAPSEDGLTVPPVFTSPGEKWKVQITGFDGLDLGPTVESNIVTILA